MRWKALWPVVPCAALAGACTELSDRAKPLPGDGATLPILRQKTGIYSHEDRPMRLVIRDQALLSQVPLVDVPVDFQTEMMLLITLGRRLSDEYRVRIERVWREGPRLRVHYEVIGPSPEAPLALSSPYCIAVVPRCDLNVDGFEARVPARRPALPDFLSEPRDVPPPPRGSPTRSRSMQQGSGNVGGGS